MKPTSFAIAWPLLLAACQNGPPADHAPPRDSACERVAEKEARAFEGLELMGTAGKIRFYGRPREMLCSEPGAEGKGECELVGATEARVESPAETYGFRTDGSAPALLLYSPKGVGCRAR